MANLKGSTYERQRRDMNFKLFALGTKKGSDNLTHSDALLTKRDMYFNDFANFLEDRGIQDKWNMLLTEENLNNFLEQRLEGLSFNTMKNYLSGFNSFLGALRDVNIKVGVSEHYLNEKYQELKTFKPNENKEPRGLQSNDILNRLKEIRYESYVIAKLMLDNGYRINEAMKIVKEPDRYIQSMKDGDYKISGVSGKGGKIYHDKVISHTDKELIRNMNHIPSKQSFNRDLKQVEENLRAHDFRYEYARNLFDKKVSEVGYDKALETVSKALNHNRKEITKYYLYVE